MNIEKCKVETVYSRNYNRFGVMVYEPRNMEYWETFGPFLDKETAEKAAAFMVSNGGRVFSDTYITRAGVRYNPETMPI